MSEQRALLPVRAPAPPLPSPACLLACLSSRPLSPTSVVGQSFNVGNNGSASLEFIVQLSRVPPFRTGFPPGNVPPGSGSASAGDDNHNHNDDDYEVLSYPYLDRYFLLCGCAAAVVVAVAVVAVAVVAVAVVAKGLLLQHPLVYWLLSGRRRSWRETTAASEVH